MRDFVDRRGVFQQRLCDLAAEQPGLPVLAETDVLELTRTAAELKASWCRPQPQRARFAFRWQEDQHAIALLEDDARDHAEAIVENERRELEAIRMANANVINLRRRA